MSIIKYTVPRIDQSPEDSSRWKACGGGCADFTHIL